MDLECLQPQLFKDFNQILKSDRMNHAYLFSGDFASFDFALYLAKSRFCENLQEGRPCGKCRECQLIEDNDFSDVKIVKPTGQIIKTDTIREMMRDFSRSGFEGKSQVFIIQDCEKMHINAATQLAGATADEIRRGMASFAGVDRRFDFALKNDKHVLLSDYAHHPAEIKQSILSIREVFDGRKIAAIFQPHLYTRTRDFYKDFADSLSLLDEVILTEIYPAREKPIPGITSQIIYDNLRPGIEKHLIEKKDIPDFVKSHDFDVLIVLGAGDAVDYVPQIKEILEHK